MRKNKHYLFLFLLLSGLSCTKQTPVSLVSHWDKSNSFEEISRKLASSHQPKCFADRYTVPYLRQEVAQLENAYVSASRVSGTWRHLNLASLPVPQANFLKNYGSKIGDLRDKNSIDYSSCMDLPCIFNKIYGKDDSVEGYVHYLWYLRFGNYLSADNLVPFERLLGEAETFPGVHDGKSFPLSYFLFSENELYGFWKLSHTLRPPFTNLTRLKEIQRIPKGEKFVGDAGSACGLAYTSGWILLADGCLKIEPNDRNKGYFYHAVTHELSHAVDSHDGYGSPKLYRSKKPDYLELAGMYEEEYMQDGKLYVRWKLTSDAKVINPYPWQEPYAKTSPQENFAESVSLFRIMGSVAKRDLSDRHHTFVSSNYYQDSFFDESNLMWTWLNDSKKEIDMLVHSAVTECKNSSSNQRSAYFKSTDFSVETLPGMANCLGDKAQKISEEIRLLSMSTKPEACTVMEEKANKDKWDVLAKDILRKAFDHYLTELKKDQEYAERLAGFYKEISDKTMAIEAFVNCYNERNEQSCYQSEVQKSATDKALMLNLPASYVSEMSERYLAYHPYDKTKAHVLQTYQNIVASNSEMIREESRRVWDSCQNMSHNDDQTPTGSHFSVGGGYMISSFYNCLNYQIPESVMDLIRSFNVGTHQIQHGKEELMLSEVVSGHMTNILKDFYQKNKVIEDRSAKEIIANDKGNLRKQILSDFGWVKSVLDAKNIEADCKREALRLINFLPLYHLKSELFGEFVEKNVCAGVSNSRELSNWLESSKEVFAKKVSAGVEEKLYLQGELLAMECLKRYPIDSAINRIRFKKQRDACLVDGWPGVENKVLSEFTTDPMVIRLKIPTNDLKRSIEANSRKIQLKIMKEKFN